MPEAPWDSADAALQEWEKSRRVPFLPDTTAASRAAVAMSQADREAYVGQLKGLVVSIEGMVSSEACDEAMRLIDHGEGAEGMLVLAWSIVQDSRRVPSWVIDTLRELAADFIPDEHWPADLDEHIE